MPKSEAIFRPARKADAAALAALIDIAGEGVPLFLWSQMKVPDQSVFEFGRARAAREQGNFSYRNATVVETDGEVVACLVDYALDDPYDISWKPKHRGRGTSMCWRHSRNFAGRASAPACWRLPRNAAGNTRRHRPA